MAAAVPLVAVAAALPEPPRFPFAVVSWGRAAGQPMALGPLPLHTAGTLPAWKPQACAPPAGQPLVGTGKALEQSAGPAQLDGWARRAAPAGCVHWPLLL